MTIFQNVRPSYDENKPFINNPFQSILTSYKKDKYLLAAGSVFLGSILSVASHLQPTSDVALLRAMEADSMSLKTALCNGKPTVVEFFADWCESCKVMAPSMRAIELKYKDSINFVALDGSNPANAEMVSTFGVDGIPHIAMVNKKAEVQTALVGAVPSQVLNQEIDALIKNNPLPFEGYDAFEEESHRPVDRNTALVCSTENN